MANTPDEDNEIPISAEELERAIAEAQAHFKRKESKILAAAGLDDEDLEEGDGDVIDLFEGDVVDEEEDDSEDDEDEDEQDEDDLDEDDEDEDEEDDLEEDDEDDDLEDDEEEDEDDDDDEDFDIDEVEIEIETETESDEVDESDVPELTELTDFSSLEIKGPLRKALEDNNYNTPTPIQAQAMPILLDEPTDFLGQAMTGTGKTMAFALPILQHIKPGKKALQALVLTPTRELALQVSQQFEKLGKHLGVEVLTIYGGSDHGAQLRGIQEGFPVAVATPGRLLEHIRRGTISFDSLTTLVLDEADQMMSMGFREEVEAIMAKRPAKRCRIWMFSATLSKEVRSVADEWLRDPQQVYLNAAKDLPAGLTQQFFATQESNKPEVLCKLLDAADDLYGLIFCQTKALASDLASYLAVRGFPVACLHGDKDQTAREEALNAFRNKEIKVLVCTDVAARGLDIPEISHVVNFSLPRESDVYLHRVGRTARSGKGGRVYNLVSPTQRGQIRHLEDVLGTEITEGQIPSRRELGNKKVAALLERFQEQEPYRAMDLLDEEWVEVLGNTSRREIAGRFIAMLMPEIFGSNPAGKHLLGQKNPQAPKEDDDSDDNFERIMAEAEKRKRTYQRMPASTSMGSRYSDKRAGEGPIRRNQSEKTSKELRRLDAADYSRPVGDYSHRPKRSSRDEASGDYSDRPKRSSRDEAGGDDRPAKRFVRVERFDGADRKPRSDERKPYGSRDSGDAKPYGKPYGSRDSGDAKPYGKPYGSRDSSDSKPSYGGKSYGSRDDRDSKPSYGGKSYGSRDSSDSKPYGKPAYGKRDDAKPYGKPYGARDDRDSKPSYGSKPYGSRDDRDSKPSYGSKPYGARDSWDDRKSSGARDDRDAKPYSKFFGKRDSGDAKPYGKREERGSYGKSSGGGSFGQAGPKRSEGGKPYGKSSGGGKSFGKGPGSGPKRSGGGFKKR